MGSLYQLISVLFCYLGHLSAHCAERKAKQRFYQNQPSSYADNNIIDLYSIRSFYIIENRRVFDNVKLNWNNAMQFIVDSEIRES